MIHVWRFLFGVLCIISMFLTCAVFFAAVWLICHYWWEAMAIFLLLAAYNIGKEYI